MDRLIRAIRESEITVQVSASGPSDGDGADLRVFDETRGVFVARAVDQASFIIDLGPDLLETSRYDEGAMADEPPLYEMGAIVASGPSWLSFLKRFGRW